jgi:hypothetical protein
MATKKAVTALRKQMVCRHPTRAELADRPAIVLTPRDQDLLVHVHKLGFLTAELVERAFFPEDAARRSRSSCCYERLRQLWLWGYLDRVELPVARVFGGRRPYLYALGRRGVGRVEAVLGGERPVQRRRLERVDDLLTEHDLKAAALWAGLRTVVAATGLPGLRWEGEREVRARGWTVKEPRVRRSIPVVPDAYCELTYPDGSVECVLVEVDMATLPLRRFRTKIAAFERFRDEGLFERRTGYEHFEVWVLAPSRRRVENLRRAARRPGRRAGRVAHRAGVRARPLPPRRGAPPPGRRPAAPVLPRGRPGDDERPAAGRQGRALLPRARRGRPRGSDVPDAAAGHGWRQGAGAAGPPAGRPGRRSGTAARPADHRRPGRAAPRPVPGARLARARRRGVPGDAPRGRPRRRPAPARAATERGVAHVRVLDGHAGGRPVRRGRGA